MMNLWPGLSACMAAQRHREGCFAALNIMQLLPSQVYATPSAFDQDPAAFHRAIFIFISPQVSFIAR